MPVLLTPPHKTFQLMVGDLSHLKPLIVTVVRSTAEHLGPNAFIAVDVARSGSRAPHIDLPNKIAFIPHQDGSVAITRCDAGIHYRGIFHTSAAARYFDNAVPEDVAGIHGAVALVETLKSVRAHGAWSAVIDCAKSFLRNFEYESEDRANHATVAAMVTGICNYVDFVNTGALDPHVDEILVVMGSAMFTDWEKHAAVYGAQFLASTPEKRRVRAQLEELLSIKSKLESFATLGIELAQRRPRSAGTTNEAVSGARQEIASLAAEIAQVNNELARLGE